MAIALMSPIAAFTPLFFFMHMIQHILLVMIAAPLLLLGAPVVPAMWALPRDTRHRVGRIFRRDHPVHSVFHFLTRPPVALAVFVITLVGWHHPALYDAAQGRSLVHDLEHALFFGTALLFWWPVVHPSGGRRRLAYGAGILYIFPAKLAGFALGALLTLTSTPYYQTYIDAPRLWGLSPLDDQQLGGLIMWVLGGLIFIIPVLVLVLMMMRDDEGHMWVPEALRDQERPVRSVAGEPDPVPDPSTV